ncbi:DUF4307 domain-containing protein [Cellulosimicrobium arenosum]|uniref:DUF4307 domain-containing protein n=1 Tax=Cellulosimicrobium arenosum TaxID=2708133 RepID=A0A927J1L9_9MICO|nr:DUF4307 domain-containing protein [Cellulosimicrobium arenosum]MBD8080246.1 DUF4307 domain-containing protein [Cellulosimicrobium arenosum]
MTDESTVPRPAAPPALPEGRYGPPSTPRRRRWAVAGISLAAVVGVVVTVLVGLDHADQDVRFQDVGFDVVDSERVDVTFEVYMDAGTTARCSVDALSESFAQVGTLDVTVGPVDTTESRWTVSVATSELATTGVVQSCLAAD